MEIKLEHKESEEYFLNALCNGLGYFSGHGVSIEYDETEYKQATNKLKSENPNNIICYEDVLMEMLRMGNKIKFVDYEGGDDDEVELTIQMVHDNVEKTPIRHLMDMINENDDAETADVILQTVLYGEIVFG